MKQSIKAKRNIGLIALTIAVIVAIILVVYFVNKADDGNGIKRGAVGQTVSTANGDISVKSAKVVDSIGDITASDGKCLIVVSVEFKANKKITLSADKFAVDNANKISVDKEGYLVDSSVLQKGESKAFKLAYEVKKGSADSYFLSGYGAKIDLCIIVS